MIAMQTLVQRLRDGGSQGPAGYRALREAVDAMKIKLEARRPAQVKKWHLKLGVANWFLGRTGDAAKHLHQADTALSQFYLGRALAQLNDIDEAHKAYERAEKMGYTATQVQHCSVQVSYLHQKHIKQAKDLIHKLDSMSSHSGEYHFQKGCLLLEEGDKQNALSSFEKAIEIDANHTGALFQLGYYNDLAGNDEEAIGFYERCVTQLPATKGALNNLGVLYEDNNQYEKAHNCYRQLSEAFPTDNKARLFLKDADASREMFFDEDAERRFDKFSQVLEVPVTDFELSVRSRNCLKKMNIRTLGDLTRVTETQLLASNNFGETSLDEIKEMLTAKGLRLGQALEEGARDDPRLPLESAHSILA